MDQEIKHQFYTTSKEAWVAMLEGIHGAKHSIDIEQFIFSNDTIGKMFLEALKKKALEGVKVRILADAFGSLDLSLSSIVTELKTLGVGVEFFNHLIPWIPKNISFWYFRDHRKILIIDEAISYVGGVCITQDMADWRDTHIMIDDKEITKSVLDAFNRMWILQELSKNKVLHWSQILKKKFEGYEKGAFITSAPLPGRRYLYKELVKLLREAKEEIFITVPYFIPTKRIFRELLKASRRGVRVKLLIPESSNYTSVDAAFRTYVEKMLKYKIEVWLYPAMHHGKTIIIDQSIAMVGSLNLDHVSLLYNFEGSLIAKNKGLVEGLMKLWNEDILISHQITEELWRERGFFKKVHEKIIWPFRRFL